MHHKMYADFHMKNLTEFLQSTVRSEVPLRLLKVVDPIARIDAPVPVAVPVVAEVVGKSEDLGVGV